MRNVVVEVDGERHVPVPDNSIMCAGDCSLYSLCHERTTGPGLCIVFQVGYNYHFVKQ